MGNKGDSKLNRNSETREEGDFYQTAPHEVRHLQREIPDLLSCVILEPCNGLGAISRLFAEKGCKTVTNDINPDFPADSHKRAQDIDWDFVREHYQRLARPAAVVTNVPFNQADEIIRRVVDSYLPFISIVRLSWLKPTKGRGEWLTANPPQGMFIYPCVNYTPHSDRAHAVDSIPRAWMFWNLPKAWLPTPRIQVYPWISSAVDVFKEGVIL